jgi:hypothetical protein
LISTTRPRRSKKIDKSRAENLDILQLTFPDYEALPSGYGGGLLKSAVTFSVPSELR